jgi:pimeloyl-ACP methyl ester carboxylesterase
VARLLMRTAIGLIAFAQMLLPNQLSAQTPNGNPNTSPDGVEASTHNSNRGALAAFEGQLGKHFSGEHLIDVGGHKLQLLKSGKGPHTIIFESGIGQGLESWNDFTHRLDSIAYSICYSRAGYGASESGQSNRTPKDIAQELHELLIQGGFKAPFILVGHSLGGTYVRMYAALYPKEVIGLVLVDPSYDRELLDLKEIDPRLGAMLSNPPPEAPPVVRDEMIGMAQIHDSGVLDPVLAVPDVPMVVLTSLRVPPGAPPYMGKITLAKRRGHEGILESSSRCMQVVTARSGHGIQFDEPNLVLDAIEWVISALPTDSAVGIRH